MNSLKDDILDSPEAVATLSQRLSEATLAIPRTPQRRQGRYVKPRTRISMNAVEQYKGWPISTERLNRSAKNEF